MADKILSRTVKYIYGAVTFSIVGILALCPFLCTYMLERNFPLPNLWIMALLTAVLAAFALHSSRRRKQGEGESLTADVTRRKDHRRLAALFALLLFGVQLFLIYNIFFYTGGDPMHVYENAMELASGGTDLENDYFSMFTNNLFLTILYSRVFAVVKSLLPILAFDAACNSAACYLVYRCLRHHVSEEASLAGMVMAMLLFGISPWIAVPYSDQMIFLIPILSYHIYQQMEEAKTGRISRRNAALWAVMIGLSVFGYLVKPTAVIMTLAILLARMIKGPGVKQRLAAIGLLACLAAGIVLSGKALDRVYEKAGFELDENAELGMTYYLMVGFDYDSDGFFNYDDVNIARSAADTSERNSLALQTTWNRIRENGPVGLLRHLIKKILLVFNDGTFAWGVEYDFYTNIIEETTPVSGFLRDLFYSTGSLFPIFLQGEQTLWLLILMLMTGLTFGAADEDRLSLMIGFLGLFAYQMLFEARARYLYVMLPVLVVIALIGADAWVKKIRKKNE